MKKLYAICACERADSFKKIELALCGGVDMLQLREKNISTSDYIEEAKKVHALTQKYGVPLIINDSAEVALRAGAEGVHVGAEDTPVGEIKRRYPSLLVGATAKTVAAAQNAEREGADYLGVGALFPSSTKGDARVITLENFKDIVQSVHIPVYAIGGITAENVGILRGIDFCGVALSSALFSAEDIFVRARALKEAINDL